MSDYFNEEQATKWVHVPVLGVIENYPQVNVLKDPKSESIMQIIEMLHASHQDVHIVQLAGIVRAADFFDESGLDFVHFMEEIFDKTELRPIRNSFHLTHRSGDIRQIPHWEWQKDGSTSDSERNFKRG